MAAYPQDKSCDFPNRNASPQGAMRTAVPVRSPQRYGVFASNTPPGSGSVPVS